jgi:predicted TIM-barrel fold metal-dependent hydrolase
MQRNRFLAGLAATTAACCAGGDEVLAQTTEPFRIDVHRHLCPPFYAQAAKSFEPTLSVPLRGWTPARSIADLDAAGIAKGYLSMPDDPGIYFGNVAAARTLARRCNEYMAELRRTYPGRYGFFAALPLPDVEGSVAEIAYAFDHLHADGIGVFSSYGPKYLGDPAFEPMWKELNRRKAIVFEHPSMTTCCKDIVPGIGESVLEYGFDTTRSIASVVFNGVAARYPAVRFIWSHAGGTMPFLIHRFDGQAQAAAKDPKLAPNLPHGLRYELKKMFYDTAQSQNAEAMGALMALVGTSQVLFGTDYPYGPSTANVNGLAALNWPDDVAMAVARDNALRLLRKAA